MANDRRTMYRSASLTFAANVPKNTSVAFHWHVVWMNFCDVWDSYEEFATALVMRGAA